MVKPTPKIWLTTPLQNSAKFRRACVTRACACVARLCLQICARKCTKAPLNKRFCYRANARALKVDRPPYYVVTLTQRVVGDPLPSISSGRVKHIPPLTHSPSITHSTPLQLAHFHFRPLVMTNRSCQITSSILNQTINPLSGTESSELKENTHETPPRMSLVALHLRVSYLNVIFVKFFLQGGRECEAREILR